MAVEAAAEPNSVQTLLPLLSGRCTSTGIYLSTIATFPPCEVCVGRLDGTGGTRITCLQHPWAHHHGNLHADRTSCIDLRVDYNRSLPAKTRVTHRVHIKRSTYWFSIDSADRWIVRCCCLTVEDSHKRRYIAGCSAVPHLQAGGADGTSFGPPNVQRGNGFTMLRFAAVHWTKSGLCFE